MKRLFLESALLALAVWGCWRWTHPPETPPTATFPGARPSLDMPAAPALRPAEPGEAMRVVPESLGAASGRAAGRARPLGSTPLLLSARGAPADERSPAPRPSPPTWDERLRDPRALGAVVALFLLCYALLARALRRGPGGRGFTND